MQGARFIECDVVLSRDLVPVCRHEPDIAQTTDVLSTRISRQQRQQEQQEQLQQCFGEGGGDSEEAGDGDGRCDGDVGQGVPIFLALDLTLAEIKRLKAVFPQDAGTATTAAATAARGSTGAAAAATAGEPSEVEGAAATAAVVGAAAECVVPWAPRSGEDTGREAIGVVEESDIVYTVTPPPDSEDLRVASLEDLLQMATAVEPAVGVAVHIQAASWHNTVLEPQLRARNTTFEDELLRLLQQYGYATGPYGSEAWRRRPSYLMAFEAGSLKYLAQRTSSPLTQVLGPTIPDTGESWDSATSPQGLVRIRSYAGSVAVARQQLLRRRQQVPALEDAETVPAAAPEHPGSGLGSDPVPGLMASELLQAMRHAGLQVFASVFKPAPREQLLPGAETWVDEISPLVLGSGLPRIWGAANGSFNAARLGNRQPRSAIDGLFTDSPRELYRLLAGLKCSSGNNVGDNGQEDEARVW
ncbi:hypothetical protein VOLCADRAFT_90098 [Volvox carteri f. nagariensis]|uniref:glycerophosphodiester phosphodiesterase n=1 Tax=Volvox carteri f. nagariensis TaxID=3068 RepID=D8TTH0_VOLCA|nr:uncharacterized protein VOLCADRAFT_90098 [Volvox carteri f. nagariensis]EFJ49305.1 hypothetical protein VOLCADRAFT_90098 [Volvox carteri f. nagariensis]|eukprot:XP_002949753.1 hypothetical protein VOLCADRAFT_90098 [Volvox carteri f. nagariensis]